MRFTIRDLLWLSLLAFVLLAWWVDRRALKSELDRLAGVRTWSRDLAEASTTFRLVKRSQPTPSQPAQNRPSE